MQDPITDDEFSGLMAPLGPFERLPRIAVAVSGGADSLALCLLADRWAKARGGTVTALTVDHGLRTEAAAEADQVGRWLARVDIAHHILRWIGAKPEADLQAAARTARYGLLGEWCRTNGVLHLLLAHHRDDQAETLLIRLARGSGVDGLAAMAAVSESDDSRLLRPLLSVSPDRLTATLQEIGQPWAEDPSNASSAFQRVRMRRLMPELSKEGMDGGRLATTARSLGRARAALEQATADLMVRCVSLDPAGFARLDAERMTRAPTELSLRLLAALCRTVSGGVYPPRLGGLERLHGLLCTGLPSRRTFSGGLLIPGNSGVVVCREPAAISPPQTLHVGERYHWDGRFSVRLSGSGIGRIEALGHPGWLAIRDRVKAKPLPSPVRAGLPALADKNGIFAIPHLGYMREMPSALVVEEIAFLPARPLAGATRCLV